MTRARAMLMSALPVLGAALLLCAAGRATAGSIVEDYYHKYPCGADDRSARLETELTYDSRPSETAQVLLDKAGRRYVFVVNLDAPFPPELVSIFEYFSACEMAKDISRSQKDLFPPPDIASVLAAADCAALVAMRRENLISLKDSLQVYEYYAFDTASGSYMGIPNGRRADRIRSCSRF